MASALQAILGTYSPLLQPDGTVVIGIAGVDWQYLIRSGIFGIALFSVFALIGAAVKRWL